MIMVSAALFFWLFLGHQHHPIHEKNLNCLGNFSGMIHTTPVIINGIISLQPWKYQDPRHFSQQPGCL